MTPSDRAKFGELLGAVYELYNRPLSPTILSMWWESLARYDLDTVREAFNRHAMNPDQGQFIPKPADIVRELGGTSADISMLAWAQVNRAVAHVGCWDSVTFDDPITNRVLQDMGGWPWLGTNLCEKEAPYIEKRFRDTYRAWRQRGLIGTELVRHLPGRYEVHNGSKGYATPAPTLIGNKKRAHLILSGGLKLEPGWEFELVRADAPPALPGPAP